VDEDEVLEVEDVKAHEEFHATKDTETSSEEEAVIDDEMS